MEKLTIITKIEDGAHYFLRGMRAEYSQTKESAIIIQKYVKEGSITQEEEHQLKAGLVDSLKMAGVVIPFVLVPGASILMPILIKVAAKYNIELMPSTFKEPKGKEEVKQDK